MKNIRQYMSRNQVDSSSRYSQEGRRVIPVNQVGMYDGERNIDDRYRVENPPLVGNIPPNSGIGYQVGGPGANYGGVGGVGGPGDTQFLRMKYPKSKEECIQEMSQILRALEQKDDQMTRMVTTHNDGVLSRFSADYDKLANQIIRQVEVQLKDNKERLLRQIRQRRNAQLAETKPIRRNMDKLRNQVIGLKDGLYRDNQYRQYISRIVLKDFQLELGQIQHDIDRLRFPNVQLALDEKYYTCFRSDLNKLIVVRDELYTRMNNDSYSPQSPNYTQQAFGQLNPHVNRDQIKRSQVTKNP